jgi:hypothetical protein
MIIIAKTTEGFLINATAEEVSEILRSVNGSVPKEINIGQKIPAIDYAGSITKIKSLKDSYCFKELISYSTRLTKEVKDLENAVNNAANIQA